MTQAFNDRTPLQRLLWLGGMAKAAGGKGVEETASGNPVVFTTDLARPLSRLALSLLPRQSGTGDPSPENIRPLLPWGEVGTWHFPENQLIINRVSSQTSSGITFTPVKDSNNKTIAIHVEGENTGNNTFFNLNYPNPGQSQLSFPPGSYVIKGATENIAFWGYYTDENDMTYQMINFSDGTFTVPENAVRSWVRLQVANGAVVNETIYPIVVKAGESITPYPVNLRKNLLPQFIDAERTAYGLTMKLNDDGSITVTGTPTNTSSVLISMKPVSLNFDAGTYTFNNGITDRSNEVYCQVVNDGGHVLFSRYAKDTYTFENAFTVTRLDIGVNVTSGEEINVTIKPMFESGSQASEYQPYIPPVYGCSVDLTTGEVWGTWAGFSKKWSEGLSATDIGSGITRKIFPMVDYLTTGQANNFCNIVPYSANEEVYPHYYYSGNGDTNRNCRIFLPSDTPDDTEITVITRLKTPVLLATLTPQQINALIGVNTVWSDADGIELTYLKKG